MAKRLSLTFIPICFFFSRLVALVYQYTGTSIFQYIDPIKSLFQIYCYLNALQPFLKPLKFTANINANLLDVLNKAVFAKWKSR